MTKEDLVSHMVHEHGFVMSEKSTTVKKRRIEDDDDEYIPVDNDHPRQRTRRAYGLRAKSATEAESSLME